jgi:hypothetical protein
MNQHQETIYQKALTSGNRDAVIQVAWAFYGLGEIAVANVLIGHIATTFGIDVPPTPIPEGFRRATAKEITKPVLTFARKALEHCTPVGKQQTATVTEKDKSKHLVMALTEHHLDNHPARPKQGYSAGEGPVFLHPGISMLVPKDNDAMGYGFGTDVKPGGMSIADETAFRKALWSNKSLMIEGSAVALSVLGLFLFRKQLGGIL